MIQNKYPVIILILFFSTVLFSDTVIWTPTNPSFGGNPYNASWLMNSAENQKKDYPEENSSGYTPKTTVEQFQESLNRQILSNLARKIVESLYDENGEMIEEGQFEMGNYSINIYEEAGVMTVALQDILTGAQTKIEIPNQ